PYQRPNNLPFPTRRSSDLSEQESPASRRQRGLLLLADAEANKNYTVSGIYERDRRLLEFLEERGIRPGARVYVSRRNYDQTLTRSEEHTSELSHEWISYAV